MNLAAITQAGSRSCAIFSRRHRCITYAARGYPPSDVPDSVDAYSQTIAADDAVAVLDALKINKAHIVGLSMGGFCTVHFGLRTPQRALSAHSRRRRLWL